MSNKNKKTYQPKLNNKFPETLPEGYSIVHGNYGKGKVYKNGKSFISADIDQHNGGYWKMAKSIKKLWNKNTRLGTYNRDLSKKLGD